MSASAGPRHVGEEYIALLRRWPREPHEASSGARPVTVLFYAFPTPDEVGLG